MINFKKYLTPKLFTGLAIVGVGATVYFAVKETKDAVRKEERVEQEKTEPGDGSGSQTEVEGEDSKARIKETAGRVAETLWTYKFTGTSALCTILFILASHKLSAKEIAALTATCGYLATNRDKLETEIRKLPGGEEALKAVKAEMAAKKAEEAADKEEPKKIWRYQCVEDTGNGDLLCLEGWSGRLFRSSLDAVEQAQARFNDYRDESFDIQAPSGDIESFPAALSMNELFDEYGMERTQLGHEFGWPADDDYYPTRRIKFINTLIALDKLDPVTKARYNEDLLVIEFDDGYQPMQCWQEI